LGDAQGAEPGADPRPEPTRRGRCDRRPRPRPHGGARPERRIRERGPDVSLFVSVCRAEGIGRRWLRQTLSDLPGLDGRGSAANAAWPRLA
jgi:hypothetical protein